MLTNATLSMFAVLSLSLITLNVMAQDKTHTLDPLIRHKLVIITPITGESIRPYVDILKDGERVEYSDNEKFNDNVYAGMTFPVVTQSMSVGKLTAGDGLKVNPEVLLRPLVIIGDDPVSQNWLKEFSDILTQRQARVYVVNVHSIERFKALKTLAPNLYLHATNGDVFAEQLHIKHYPFYADKNGVLR